MGVEEMPTWSPCCQKPDETPQLLETERVVADPPVTVWMVNPLISSPVQHHW